MMRNRSSFAEYESLKAELPEITKAYQDITKELEQIQMQYAAKKSEIATLERTTDNLSKSVSAVMQLKSIQSRNIRNSIPARQHLKPGIHKGPPDWQQGEGLKT